jgi:hypothetical protein
MKLHQPNRDQSGQYVQFLSLSSSSAAEPFAGGSAYPPTSPTVIHVEVGRLPAQDDAGEPTRDDPPDPIR